MKLLTLAAILVLDPPLVATRSRPAIDASQSCCGSPGLRAHPAPDRWRLTSRTSSNETSLQVTPDDVARLLDYLATGTPTACPLEGVHEHVFRGPHRFHEWEPGT